MAGELDPSLLVRRPHPSDPQLSPDGSTLLFEVASVEGDRTRSRLWTCGRGGSELRSLTSEGAADGGARWSPDGRWIAFASDRPEGDRWGVFVLPAAGGEAREVVTSPRPIAGIAWSPDGERIAYASEVDAGVDSEIVRVTRHAAHKLDGRGYIGDRRSQVFVVDARGGEPRQVTSGGWEHGGPRWSPNGKRLAMVTSLITSSRLSVVDVETGEETLLGPDPGVVGGCSWGPDGSLLVMADPGRTYQLDFYLLDPGARELRRLTDDPGVQPHTGFPGWMPPSPPVWLDADRVLVHALRAGRSGIYELSIGDGSVREVETWDAAHVGFSADASGRWLAQTRQSLSEPAEVFVYDRESGQGSTVTAFGQAVAAAAPGAWERFAVQRDGIEVEGWLIKPAGFEAGRRYPVVLDIHGGPNSWHGHQWYDHQQLMAASGYIVAFANPRGSSTYGREFTMRVYRDWGGEDFLDLMAVVDHVAALPYADPSRIGVRGYSYGGYMTSWILGRTDRFKAAMVGAPCFDLISMWGTSDIGAAWDDIQWGGSPVENEPFYRERSPSTWTQRAVTPTLVVHGEADIRCPIGQGEELFTALLEAGVETEFARYPDASHLFPFTGKPAQREDLLKRELAWFDAHLG